MRKSKPLSICSTPERQAQLAGHLVEPDRSRARTQASSDATVLNGGSLLRHDEAAESEEVDRENLGRPEAQGAKLAASGATRVIMMTANSAPTNEDSEGGGERLAGAPLLRHRIAVERGRHRPRFAGYVEQIST